jgi:hypothetical protein
MVERVGVAVGLGMSVGVRVGAGVWVGAADGVGVGDAAGVGVAAIGAAVGAAGPARKCPTSQMPASTRHRKRSVYRIRRRANGLIPAPDGYLENVAGGRHPGDKTIIP